jgi:hypothetical protein
MQAIKWYEVRQERLTHDRLGMAGGTSRQVLYSTILSPNSAWDILGPPYTRSMMPAPRLPSLIGRTQPPRRLAV